MISDGPTRLIDGYDRQDGHATVRVPHPAATPDLSEEVAQLRAALVSNRRISMAMGILMRDRDIDEHAAFAVLRRLSQDTNRKLRDIADEIVARPRSALTPGPASVGTACPPTATEPDPDAVPRPDEVGPHRPRRAVATKGA